MGNIITNEQYMANSEELHHAYFAQFITEGIKYFVESTYTPEQITELYQKDRHLNNLPGRWLSVFDRITENNKSGLASINHKINGTASWSYSMGCCAIKAYMAIYARIQSK